jgi:response regulator NasT
MEIEFPDSNPFFRYPRVKADPPVTILYAEDNRILEQFVKDVLELAGWHVHACRDGITAECLLETARPFDLLIFDDELDFIRGMQLVKNVRGMEHRHGTPVILLSLENRADEAREAGANAFLRKPNNIIQLVDTIRALLAARAAERERIEAELLAQEEEAARLNRE